MTFKRVAPDGQLYTRPEFYAFFGGLDEWNEAEASEVVVDDAGAVVPAQSPLARHRRAQQIAQPLQHAEPQPPGVQSLQQAGSQPPLRGIPKNGKPFDGKSFQPCQAFAGARPGWCFKNGKSGLGYYLDTYGPRLKEKEEMEEAVRTVARREAEVRRDAAKAQEEARAAAAAREEAARRDAAKAAEKAAAECPWAAAQSSLADRRERIRNSHDWSAFKLFEILDAGVLATEAKAWLDLHPRAPTVEARDQVAARRLEVLRRILRPTASTPQLCLPIQWESLPLVRSQIDHKQLNVTLDTAPTGQTVVVVDTKGKNYTVRVPSH